VELPCRLQLVSCGARNARDGWAVDETYKSQKHPRRMGLSDGRRDRQPRHQHQQLVDVDDRHQQREHERPDDEADDAERLHYQESNPQGKPARCMRGELRYPPRRRRRATRSEPLLEEEERRRLEDLLGVLNGRILRLVVGLCAVDDRLTRVDSERNGVASV